MKGLLDTAGALIIIFAFSWLLLLIVLAYTVTWEFPILYRQRRIGKGNVPFWLYKFRTLSVGHESKPQQIFRLGSLLRATSLDELPQLRNILFGEMSFVGPRPLPEEYLSLYSNEQIKRHDVRPGITGWAQVNGRNSISWAKKFELDLYYVSHITFKFDLTILFKTVALLLSFNKDLSLSEEKFRGT